MNDAPGAAHDAPRYPYEFDADLRQKARRISARLFRISVASMILNASLLAVLTFAGPGVWLAASLRHLEWFLRVVVFIAFIVLIFYAADLPLAYIGYTIRRRSGIATAGALRWLADSVKALLISIVTIAVSSILLFALIGISDLWWLLAATVYVAFMIAYSRFFPLLTLRFFYRIRPLEEGEAKRSIVSLLRALSLDDLGVSVMNASSRSRHANAFVAGLGQGKRIVLYDNIIRLFTPAEVTCITAHELGHYTSGDGFRSTMLQAVISYGSAYLLFLVYGVARGLNYVYFPADPYILLLFSVMLTVTGAGISPLINYLSRRRERRADMFSLSACGDPVAFISSEKRLCDVNLMDDDPPLIRRLLFASHPSTAERVKLGEQWFQSGETAKEG